MGGEKLAITSGVFVDEELHRKHRATLDTRCETIDSVISRGNQLVVLPHLMQLVKIVWCQ